MSHLSAEKIACSVGILTFNSGKSIQSTLESVKSFDDIIVCDGGSTDSTVSIAEDFGARVLYQDKEFKNIDGSLKDFSGVRNQTLEAAKHKWFLFLDSDEYLGNELIEEVAILVGLNKPLAYQVPRVYVWKGELIACASTYPNYQMRFFHRDVANNFVKKVHERIELKKGVVSKKLKNPIYVPFTETVGDLKKKWKKYIFIEVARHKNLSFKRWVQIAWREFAVAVLFGLRIVRNFMFCRGKSMPPKFELLRIWYQFALVLALFQTVSFSDRKKL